MERVSSGSEEATIKSDSIIEAIPTTSIATGDSVSSPSHSQVTRLEHLLDVSNQHSIAFDSDVRIDVSSKDYRAFCLLIHREQGALLLHCTRKKKKPPHYQLPGGHIDVDEFQQVAGCQGNVVTQEELYCAARIGCARELYEETGIDFRNRLEDFFPMVLYSTGTGNSKQKLLINEYNHRLLFVCEVKDEDFPTETRSGSRKRRFEEDSSSHLLLELSVEHSGFRFFKHAGDISNNLRFHSGGNLQKAVEKAYTIR